MTQHRIFDSRQGIFAFDFQKASSLASVSAQS
jgi:hypothetical protein